MPCERELMQEVANAYFGLRVVGDAKPIEGIGRLDAAVHAALATCDESPWRSMESAPKDETGVLLCFGDGRVEKALWWKWYDEWVDPREYMILRNPVLWMPLPAAQEVKP